MTEIIFGIIGGLGLFIFGMQYMAEGLQKAAGDRMRKILKVLTATPIIGVAVGAIVTAILQSSSATTVMIVGFVNAGLMTLKQAAGVIMGANIGTTITAQMISFHLDAVALPAIGIGFGLMLFSKVKLYKYVGQVLLGFGILFLGMQIMSDALRPLRDYEGFSHMIEAFSEYPILAVLAGVIITVAVQSSTATTAILLAVSSQGLISFTAAVPIILGTNIGTTITAMLASIGANVAARRTAAAHALFNICGTVLFLIFLSPFSSFVLSISSATSVSRQIANAHTVFNIVNTLVWLPLVGVLVALATKLVKGEDVVTERGPKYLDYHAIGTPSIALGLATKEFVRMAEITSRMLSSSRQAFLEDDMKLVGDVEQLEDMVDELEPLIVKYLSTMLSRTGLTESGAKRLTYLMHAAGDVERVADHAMNLAEAASLKREQKLPFSDRAIEEFNDMFEKVFKMYSLSVDALCDSNKNKALEVINMEKSIDELEETLRMNHMDRLNQGKCYPSSGVVYIQMMGDLERVADHSTNIAERATDSLKEADVDEINKNIRGAAYEHRS